MSPRQLSAHLHRQYPRLCCRCSWQSRVRTTGNAPDNPPSSLYHARRTYLELHTHFPACEPLLCSALLLRHASVDSYIKPCPSTLDTAPDVPSLPSSLWLSLSLSLSLSALHSPRTLELHCQGRPETSGFRRDPRSILPTAASSNSSTDRALDPGNSRSA